MNSRKNQKKILISVGLLICVFVVLWGSLEEAQAKPLAGGYDCSSQTVISTADCVVLGTIYIETGGISWTTYTNWLSTPDPCTWFGITCGGGTPPFPITGISLNGNNLTGSIPTNLGTLTSLTVLDLSDNFLAGSIPTELGDMTSLTWLILGQNELDGTLPSSLGSLANLERLFVQDNQITDVLPSELGNLSNLEYLYLDKNYFYGKLPQSFINLTSMAFFTFHDTPLCEPQNPSFQAWLSSVGSVASTGVPCTLFIDDFETGDFSLWTRFNDGNGYLYPCTDASINGTYGACVDRGTDKRKQLIDETPVNQVVYNVRFNIDINSLSMAEGTRFRFMQVKMGAERPYFIVLKRLGGQYLIQLNVLLDDRTKVKTGWYPLSDGPHTIEAHWHASDPMFMFNDGGASLFIDDVQLESLIALANETIFVDTFKIGFTSRLDGKPISGIFYLDDIATSNSQPIGLP